MEENKNDQVFRYTYSAGMQAEVKSIRKKYLAPEEDKMEQLRRLDARVTSRATMFSLVIGILGALILGVGMCCVLLWQDVWFVPGIIVGVLGMGVVGIAYPAYLRILQIEREKAAPEILRLSEELMK